MAFHSNVRSLAVLMSLVSVQVSLGAGEGCMLPTVQHARNCGSGHEMASDHTCYAQCASGYTVGSADSALANHPHGIKCKDGELTPAGGQFECRPNDEL